ncbi:hypothetical protein [Streptomyces sp. bgisy100]|uniref:hypothetical protein n=1 Tax=Streptomyces sp. bgisy100 TaxID=3413783 RepID=UPI003D70BEC8
MREHPSPWFHSLTESVFALAAATRECRAARQTAQAAVWNTEPARLRPAEGSVSVAGRDFIRPHVDTLWRLGDLYQDVESRAKELYENTALAYACGTAAALLAVLDGARPRHIELPRVNGLYVPPEGLLPDLAERLATWEGHDRLALLRRDVIDRGSARAEVDAFAFNEDLADCPSADVISAAKIAAGLADSAHAYGEAAEEALHFALLAAPAGTTEETE